MGHSPLVKKNSKLWEASQSQWSRNETPDGKRARHEKMYLLSSNSSVIKQESQDNIQTKASLRSRGLNSELSAMGSLD